MTQYEQENDFGRGGGEVDEETYEQAWRNAERRRGEEDPVDHDDDLDEDVERRT
ncbi:MAG TPA: hypothetical protein VLD16_02775 [Gaiellaceae bacterium]|nr:hypothetical protein [Gaiellaceae bacterium]